MLFSWEGCGICQMKDLEWKIKGKEIMLLYEGWFHKTMTVLMIYVWNLEFCVLSFRKYIVFKMSSMYQHCAICFYVLFLSLCWLSFLIAYDIFKQSPLYEKEVFSHYLWLRFFAQNTIISESDKCYEQN